MRGRRVPRRRIFRSDRVLVLMRGRRQPDGTRPGAARLEDHVELQAVAPEGGAGRRDHESEAFVTRRIDPDHSGRLLAGALRAPGRASLLHLEDVREVGLQDELHPQRHGLPRIAAQRDLLAQAPVDPAIALHDEWRVGAPRDVAGSSHRDRTVRPRRRRREGFDGIAVDQQRPPRDESRVVEEHPVRQLRRDVAIRAGDAERRALDDRDRPGSSGVRERVRVPSGHVVVDLRVGPSRLPDIQGVRPDVPRYVRPSAGRGD